MSAGEDDLNNRLRAGILDLRSLAADLKEDDKKQKAQSIDQRLAAASAKGENSPRGPEVTQRSPPRTSTPPTPTPPTFTPTTLTSLTSTPAHHHPCHHHPYHCHSYSTSPQLLPLLPLHPSSTLHAALFTSKPSLVQSEVPLRALCMLRLLAPPNSTPPTLLAPPSRHLPPATAASPYTPAPPHPHALLHPCSGCGLPRRCYGRGGIRRARRARCRGCRRARSRVHAAPLGRKRGRMRGGRACGTTRRARRRRRPVHAWRRTRRRAEARRVRGAAAVVAVVAWAP